MPQKFTAILRRSKLEYVAVCLELNVAARGDNLVDVERNLMEPDWVKEPEDGFVLKPLEIHEVPSYV